MRRMVLTALLLGWGPVWSQTVNFNQKFRLPRGYDSWVVAADFNGDGKLDLAAGAAPGISAVFLGRGDGTFADPIQTSPSEEATMAVAADFNRDGKMDIALSSGHLLLGNGDGTFQRPINLGFSGKLTVADFNGDGKQDLAVLASGVSVYLGLGDGGFRLSASLRVESQAPAALITGDFDGDHKADLAAGAGDKLWVWTGLGDGMFRSPQATELATTPMDPTIVSAMIAGDFNGDGKLDIFVAHVAQFGGATIWLGNGDGTFQRGSIVSGVLGSLASSLAAGDFDGDGNLDVIVGYSFDDFIGMPNVALVAGKGDGSFRGAVNLSWSGDQVVSGDFTGAGKPDLVLYGEVLINDGPAAVSAANLVARLAPESLASIFGSRLASTTVASSPPFPTSLGGIGVRIRDRTGAEHMAPLLYISPNQINFQVPAGTDSGSATVSVVGATPAPAVWNARVEVVAPALFTVAPYSDSAIPAATAVRIEADGSQIPVSVFQCAASGCVLLPIHLDRPVYLILYGTGIRNRTSPADVQCNFAGFLSQASYAGPQEVPGVDQINVLIPSSLRQPANHYAGFELVITVNGVRANPVRLLVH